MITVLIVDDEINIRIFIEKLIPWKELGIDNLVFLKNGSEALDYIKAHPVKIVITDIKMPIMGGLELIRSASELPVSPKFIVLSSYDDFEFVKEAFKLGVHDYFLKSEINAGDLKSSVTNILHRIELESQSKKYDELIKNETDRAANFIFPDINRNLHRFLFDNSYVVNNDDFLPLTDDSRLCVAILRLHINHTTKVKFGTDKLNNLINSITASIHNLLSRDNAGYVIKSPTPTHLVLLLTKPSENNVLFSRIHKLLDTKFFIEFSGGSGEIFVGIKNLKECYYQALKATEATVYYEKNYILSYSIVKRLNYTTEKTDISGKVLFLENMLSFITTENVLLYLNNVIVSKPDLSVTMSVKDLKNLYNTYYSTILNYCNKHGLSDLMENNLNKYVYEISLYGNLDDLNLWLKSTLMSLALYTSEADYIFEQIKQYISNNYDKPITLDSLSQRFNLSSSYISRMFHKNFGLSISSYLTQLRMQSACFYLKNTDMMIYEISAKLGYNNVASFTKSFKNFKGVSPESFRKSSDSDNI